MTSFNDIFQKARGFIYRNARPIELARWKFHFENGKVEDVLTALSAYQNEDGGFGHALEADSFNPNSSPIQTLHACEILRKTDFKDGSHPIVKGILRYLDSGADFSEKYNQWLSTVRSNDDYPHAIWWGYSEKEGDFRYNPTAALAGFILRFADKESPLYEKAEKIAKQAYEWFISNAPYGDDHTAACFIRLYEYLSEADIELLDMNMFKEKLREEVRADICRETEKWKTEYVCLPSVFINSKDSIFYESNGGLVEKELALISETQLSDGSYLVPWIWCNDYKEFQLAENWWKSEIIIRKLIFLKAFE